MRPIGGYFSLELPRGAEYHRNALRLNTGRNCLEYILRARGYKKVYLPYYTCDVVLEPFFKLDVEYAYYHIDRQLELADGFSLAEGEALLYTNYFGLKQAYVETLAKRYGKQLIVDDTQAFYADPVPGIDTFYTCRKFFGVPDGAYLYTDATLDLRMEQDVSFGRMSFLLKRLDLGAESGYADFREQREELAGQPIKLMSNLTRHMMEGIDYRAAAQRRCANFRFLQASLSGSNQLSLPLPDKAVPMVYPYLTEDKALKQRLIANKVFVATYWPNVLEWCRPEDWEYDLAERTIFIPVDQRYGEAEMKRIIETL